jgi:hypothetical protein
MKTNFKKLALTAGVTAALAAGSMSAHAIIQAVPGGGQLVPLFFFSSKDIGFGAGANTVVKVIVPKSVGVDTLTEYLNPTLTAAFSVQDFNTITAKPTQATFPYKDQGNFIHWTFLNAISQHVVNGEIRVTPEDVLVFDAKGLLQNKYEWDGAVGYLVLQTKKSYDVPAEGADFAFAADAWLTTPGTVTPTAVNIPTLPLADGPDVTTYPTTFNNIISKPVADSPLVNMYPIVSPIVSGIRTGAVPTSKPGDPSNTAFSVIDLSFADRVTNENLLVVWNDRLYGQAFAQEYDQDELGCSTNLSIPYQLNITKVTTLPSGSGILGAPANALAVEDQYAAWNKVFGLPYPDYTQGGTNTLCTTAYIDSENSRLRDWGFLRLTVQSPVNPDPTSPAGAFASAVAFTIPLQASSPAPTSVNPTVTPTLIGIERGFFGAW